MFTSALSIHPSGQRTHAGRHRSCGRGPLQTSACSTSSPPTSAKVAGSPSKKMNIKDKPTSCISTSVSSKGGPAWTIPRRRYWLGSQLSPTSSTTSGSHRAAGSDASRACRNAARTQLGRTGQRSHGASRTTLGGKHHHPCAGAPRIPCHHRHAWRSLDCASSLLSSPDLTVTCAPGLTSALLITTDVSDRLDSENHHKGLLYPKLCIPYTLQAGRSKKPFQLAWGKDVLHHLTALQGHSSPGKRLRTSHHPTCPLRTEVPSPPTTAT